MSICLYVGNTFINMASFAHNITYMTGLSSFRLFLRLLQREVTQPIYLEV